MPQKYRVIISPNALSQLESILDYVAADSPANAVKVIDRLLDEIQALETFPGRYAEIKTDDPAASHLRLMPSQPFRIIYEILREQAVVRVLIVEHGARDRHP
jgi:plasmid stabilization system protein ParE